VIARVWRGATAATDRDRYLEYLEETGLREYRETPGNRGVLVLTRSVEDRMEFTIVTLWDSREAVAAFAGPDAERAVFYPEDDRFLVDRDETVTHYDVLVDRRGEGDAR
jgi:heme-degrading monooxygenase HmoA